MMLLSHKKFMRLITLLNEDIQWQNSMSVEKKNPIVYFTILSIKYNSIIIFFSSSDYIRALQVLKVKVIFENKLSNQFLLLPILLEILFFNFGDWLFWFLLIFYVAQQFFPTAVLRSNHNLCTYPSKLMLSSILKHCKKIILSIINMRNFCSNEFFFFSKRIEGRAG